MYISHLCRAWYVSRLTGLIIFSEVASSEVLRYAIFPSQIRSSFIGPNIFLSTLPEFEKSDFESNCPWPVRTFLFKQWTHLSHPRYLNNALQSPNNGVIAGEIWPYVMQLITTKGKVVNKRYDELLNGKGKGDCVEHAINTATSRKHWLQ
jgi:hypothetical protein